MKRPRLLLLAIASLTAGWFSGCATSPPTPQFSLSDAANANAPEGAPAAVPTLVSGAEPLPEPPSTNQMEMEMDHSGPGPPGQMEHRQHEYPEEDE